MTDSTTQLTALNTTPRQYSLAAILGIWAAATLPMGVLAFVVVPAVIPHTQLHPGLVFWIAMVAGMIWQFVLALLLLRAEPGGLHWKSLRKRIWLQPPSDPKTGLPRRSLYLWAIPAIAVNQFGDWLATPLVDLWARLVTAIPQPAYTYIQGLADPQFRGQWWILALLIVSCLFNYLLGEELLFRGVLLPRMAGVFGRWDWVANTVLFGLYHVHKIWALPAMVLSSFGIAWAARRYRSFWMGVIVHGIDSVMLIVMTTAVLAGLVP